MHFGATLCFKGGVRDHMMEQENTSPKLSLRDRVANFLTRWQQTRDERNKYRDAKKVINQRLEELKNEPIHAEGMDTTGADLGI